jgi:hypothetical protein
MTDSPPPAAQFFLLPGCPHVTHSECNYSLVSLTGLSEYLLSKDIGRITFDALDQQWRPMGDRAVMVWPRLPEEAKALKIYRKSSGTLEAPKPFKAYVATSAAPEPVFGFTPAFNRYRGTP